MGQNPTGLATIPSAITPTPNQKSSVSDKQPCARAQCEGRMREVKECGWSCSGRLICVLIDLTAAALRFSQLLFQAAQVLAAYLSKGMFSNFQRGLLAIGLSRKRYAL
jgi:hypothetical protein